MKIKGNHLDSKHVCGDFSCFCQSSTERISRPFTLSFLVSCDLFPGESLLTSFYNHWMTLPKPGPGHRDSNFYCIRTKKFYLLLYCRQDIYESLPEGKNIGG